MTAHCRVALLGGAELEIRVEGRGQGKERMKEYRIR